MQYGFVIDHDVCIGCHACTVACKAENDVPVGGFRTSVKYVESGRFPEVKRHFLVQRCNHCSDAPCVTICPVNALEKRADGIVDIDRDACIGCRACMQACPYDAIYLNEDSGAVEKCHYCAHRVDVGLAPACVNVCPVNAIIPGDLEDRESTISLTILNNETKVRRAEQGTGPNVYYKGAADVALEPGRAATDSMYLWSDKPATKPEPWPADVPTETDARVVLDDGHRIEWGWPVSLYLVTKGIAGGAAMLAPFVGAFAASEAGWMRFVPELVSLVFVLITFFLLIEDLARPARFYRLLTRPNWKSWLVRGGVVLGAFAAVTVLILSAMVGGYDEVAVGLRWVNVPLGFAAAVYTAFLFGQCKGRDLWESELLLPHLYFQAALCGGVALLPFAAGDAWLVAAVVVGGVGHVGLSLVERFRKHHTANARQAAGFMGVVRVLGLKGFRDGLVIGVAGVLLAFVLPWGAWVPVLVGLFLYEHAFVRGGQLPPLS